jgi:adenylate cyclase
LIKESGSALTTRVPLAPIKYWVYATSYWDMWKRAIELFRKSLAGNARLYYTHMSLAAALGLRGSLVEARVALAEGIRLRPDITSVARVRTSIPYSNRQYRGLLEEMVIPGLRKAGLPEE